MIRKTTSARSTPPTPALDTARRDRQTYALRLVLSLIVSLAIILGANTLASAQTPRPTVTPSPTLATAKPKAPTPTPRPTATATPLHNKAATATMAATMAAAFTTPAPQPTSRPRTTDKVVYLTFDDGPGEWTQPILDVLAEYNAHATFFVLGVQAAEWPDMIETIYEAGHGVANHTWKHVNLVGVSKSYFEDEIGDTAEAIGPHESKCLRPPYGARNQTTYDYAEDLGYEIALWSIDTGDWRQPGAHAIAAETFNHLHNRAVILMHDGGGDRSQTVAALRIMLPELIARGYSMRAVCRDDPMPQVGDSLVGIPSELNLEVPTPEPVLAAAPTPVSAQPGDEPAFAGDSIAVPPAEAVSEADEAATLAEGSAGAITFPVQGATVRGRILVQGYVNAQSAESTTTSTTSSAPSITSWRLDLLDVDPPVNLATGEPTSRTGALGVWDTRLVDNGEHTLRLEITHADGNIEQRIVNVIVRN